jgi:arylsulfatase A-like enzyme
MASQKEFKRRDFLKLVGTLPLLKLAGSTLVEKIEQEGNATNVLVLVFDALSARNVSLYGYPRKTTPNFERFAEISTVFHRHYAAGSFTSPGTASILTGTYPWSHRVFHLYGTVIEGFEDRNIFHIFPGDLYTRMTFTHNDLASMLLHQFGQDVDLHKKTKELCLFNEYLLSEGILEKDHNAVFLGERTVTRGQRGQDLQLPSSLFLSALHRIWRNKGKGDFLAEYRDRFPRGLPSTNAGPFVYLLEDAIDWVQQAIVTQGGLFFAYFHFLPPHEPYTTRREFINIFRDGWAPVQKPQHHFTEGHTDDVLNVKRREYDEYIAYVDAEFGRLFDFMDAHDLLENTYVILTSDHGEMFERGILEHITPTLYEPITRVPLLIHGPGQSARQDVLANTSCVDLLPTICHFIGKETPEWSEGEVLPPYSESGIDPVRSVFTMDAKSNPKNAPLRKGTISMVKGNHKLIYYFGYDDFNDQFELYDLENDPEELENLYSANESTAKDLREELLSKLQEVNGPYQRN